MTPKTSERQTAAPVTREPAIYAFPANGCGPNTPLYIVGIDTPLGLSRGYGFQMERERHRDGLPVRWLGPFLLEDGRTVKVRPSTCGAGCFCAAEYKVIRKAAS